MAYNWQKIKEDSLELIEEHRIPFIEHLISYLPCSKDAFYANKLHESDEIKKAIDLQKTKIKSKLLFRMSESDNATAQIAAYKLLSNSFELKKLTGQFVDHTSKGNQIQGFNIAPPDDSTDKPDN